MNLGQTVYKKLCDETKVEPEISGGQSSDQKWNKEILAKKGCSPMLGPCKQTTRFVRSFTKKNSESFDKNKKNCRRFSSGYALNPKALIKVSKVSWTSHLSYELLRSSFERKFDKTNFTSLK